MKIPASIAFMVTCLLLATSTGYSQQTIHDAAKAGNLAAVERHLQQGIAVDARDEKNQTPLMWAASMGHLDVVKLLISEGADMHAMSKTGKTPLMLAVYYGKQDIVNYLVAKETDLNARTQANPVKKRNTEVIGNTAYERNDDGSLKAIGPASFVVHEFKSKRDRDTYIDREQRQMQNDLTTDDNYNNDGGFPRPDFSGGLNADDGLPVMTIYNNDGSTVTHARDFKRVIHKDSSGNIESYPVPHYYEIKP